MALLAPRKIAWKVATFWMASVSFFLKHLTKCDVEFRGLDNIPEGGFIIASKHQSTWEAFSLAHVMGDIVYIMKRELMFIPIFGWFAAKSKMIPINRDKRSQAIKPMLKAARRAIADNRRLVIFMEGTRLSAGKTQPYKIGVARLYRDLNCPVVPVALNSGLFWPRNSFWRYPGKIIAEVLPPIMPGKSQRELLRELQNQIEEASNNLIFEAAKGENPPPTINAALKELEARGIHIEEQSEQTDNAAT